MVKPSTHRVLQLVLDRYGDQDVQVMTALTRCHDGEASVTRTFAFADHNQLSYPVLADEEASILRQGVPGEGALVVIGPDMVVRAMGSIALSDAAIENWIEDFLPAAE